jgi:hypothetical protein
MTAPTSGSVLDDPRVLRAMESYTSALHWNSCTPPPRR